MPLVCCVGGGFSGKSNSKNWVRFFSSLDMFRLNGGQGHVALRIIFPFFLFKSIFLNYKFLTVCWPDCKHTKHTSLYFKSHSQIYQFKFNVYYIFLLAYENMKIKFIFCQWVVVERLLAIHMRCSSIRFMYIRFSF